MADTELIDHTGRTVFRGTQKPPGGGAQPGAARVLGPFPFTFATPTLEAGVDFYTPTVGDMLLDFWIETDTAWDGTTPLCDIGSALMFANQGRGLIILLSNGSACDLTAADTLVTADGLLVGASHPQGGSSGQLMTASGGSPPDRLIPARFVTTDSLQVVVSTDGTTSGSATGSLAGASAVYLVVATPATP